MYLFIMAVKKIKAITTSKNDTAKIIPDYNEGKKARGVLRAINHPLRQKMVALINKEKSINVINIYVKLRLRQSVASQHLAILRRAGFVEGVRDGKFTNYKINKERMAQVSKLISDINKRQPR